MKIKDSNLFKFPKNQSAIEDSHDREDLERRDKDKNKESDDFTTKNVKGNKIVDKNLYDSEHVNKGDYTARQPDRRDQKGSAFDGGINDTNINPNS